MFTYVTEQDWKSSNLPPLSVKILPSKECNSFFRVRDLLDMDLEAEAGKQGTNEVMWAVFTAFIK